MLHRYVELALHGRADAADDGPIPVTIATDSPVAIDGFSEILDCTPAGADLSRAPLSLIVAHDRNRLAVGIVDRLRALGNKVVGEVTFGSSDEARQIRADVVKGVHRYVSVGYERIGQPRESAAGLVFRWRPHEVSIVPAPADIKAGFFRSHQGNTMPQDTEDTVDSGGQHDQHMSRSARRSLARQAGADAERDLAERTRCADITSLCERHGFAGRAAGFITAGTTVDQVRAALLDRWAAEDERSGNGARNVAPYVARESTDGRELLVETLVARLGGRPGGDVLRNATFTDIAVRSLEAQGVAVNPRDSRDRIIERALSTRMMGTSDFPQLLGDAIGRVLAERYAELPPALRAVSRLNVLRDFRDRQVIRMDGAPSLEKVNEAGEFKHGSAGDASNSWRLATYGRMLALSRQALVNDDLGGFELLISRFAESAARRESEELVALLVSPPSVDGAAVFHVDNSSLITNVLGIAGLAAAVAKLRAQREAGQLVGQEPGFLVVPAALEMTARQLVAGITANARADVQPWTLEVVVEPRLDTTSATAWYLVSEAQRALEYGYLEGAEGLQTFTREGWSVDGVEVKARLDFGCGWVSPIGWVKSTGAGA